MVNEKLDPLLENYKFKRTNSKAIKLLSEATGWEGDCDDFAITALFLLSDECTDKFLLNLIFNPRVKIVKCTIMNGWTMQDHYVLRYNGMYIDNIDKKWMSLEQMQNSRFRYKVDMLGRERFYSVLYRLIGKK